MMNELDSKIYIFQFLSDYIMVATAVWLIVLTIIVVGSIPVLLIWLTTFPHTKLLIGTFSSLSSFHGSLHPTIFEPNS
jgi:hypothetical protein